jgi:hypothetical protein
VKVPGAVIVDSTIGTLKVAEIFLLAGTPVEPLCGAV